MTVATSQLRAVLCNPNTFHYTQAHIRIYLSRNCPQEIRQKDKQRHYAFTYCDYQVVVGVNGQYAQVSVCACIQTYMYACVYNMEVCLQGSYI